MRIISGTLKGVSIKESQAPSTHPMSEKLRGAIFNALGDIEGLTFLDGCAGTGMVGFEAMSRGAGRVDAVEKDDRAFAELSKNAKMVLGKDATNYRPFHYGIRQFFKKNNLPVYDVMVIDPPYDLITPGKINIVQSDHFDGIHLHLAKDGIMIFSLPSGIDAPRLPGLVPIQQKTHGVAQLIYYRHG